MLSKRVYPFSRSLTTIIQRRSTAQLHGKNFIGFKLSADESAKSRKAYDAHRKSPVLEDIKFYDATKSEIDEALSLAKKATKPLRLLDFDQHVEFLKRIAKEISKIRDQVINRAMLETGYSQQRVEKEFNETLFQIEDFTKYVEEGSYVNAKIHREANKPDIARMMIPIGPVVVFGASNFPFRYSTAGGDLISALAARCPVVIKPHIAHLGVSELIGNAIQKAAMDARMPEGTFSLLHGNKTVGCSLVVHKDVSAIGFTGSRAVGRLIFDMAMTREVPIPVYASMQSVNPQFILPDALEHDYWRLAREFCDAFTAFGGQHCTNPGLVITLGNVDHFIKKLITEVKKVPNVTMLTPEIRNNYTRGISAFSRVEGVKIEVHNSDHLVGAGATVLSTDFATFIKNKQELSQEVFGPATLIVKCRTLSEVKEVVHNLEGQLSASIHATENDMKLAKELSQDLVDVVGRIIWNQFPTDVEIVPAMFHGGPYPATSDVRFSSVGRTAIWRWMRPICYQNFHTAQELLPGVLRDTPTRPIVREENMVYVKH